MVSTYTPSQLALYANHIDLPAKYHHANHPSPNLELLNILHVHQISSIPYENLSLHYSASHAPPSLDPQDLFEKILGTDRGRGGYCVELTVFFKHILLAYGFMVYSAGVRIRPRVGGVPGGEYMGWAHSVNLVTLPCAGDAGASGEGAGTMQYMVDVSFGGDGATRPLPLIHGHVTRNLGSQEVRLLREFMPGQTVRDEEGRKMWIYQYRNGPEKEWNSFYAVTEMEFLEADLEVINAFAGLVSFQARQVLVVKFLRRREVAGDARGENGDGHADEEAIVERVYRKVMCAGGEIKVNGGGRTRVVESCKNEEERVEALRHWFGIELTEEERKGIEGFVTEIKG